MLGDVFVLTSPDKEKGTLLELKGKGCRQMESYLLAQHRSWYDFLMDALVEGGVMKRLDLAINDMAGILDIPELTGNATVKNVFPYSAASRVTAAVSW